MPPLQANMQALQSAASAAKYLIAGLDCGWTGNFLLKETNKKPFRVLVITQHFTSAWAAGLIKYIECLSSL